MANVKEAAVEKRVKLYSRGSHGGHTTPCGICEHERSQHIVGCDSPGCHWPGCRCGEFYSGEITTAEVEDEDQLKLFGA